MTAVTVVVPTRHESENVATLLDRLPDGVTRVIFVDDSDDDTPQRIAEARSARPDGWVTLIHRATGNRAGGLSGAVTRGFADIANGWVCVMDGDLQHPPEVVADLVARAGVGDVDLVVACRAGDEAWEAMSAFRRVLSAMAGRAARLAFRRRLATLDPMSGFFLVRRSSLHLDRLHADGFKILLEILITHPELRVTEVNYVFARRSSGTSKGDIREGLRYGRHLAGLMLRSARSPRRRRGR